METNKFWYMLPSYSLRTANHREYQENHIKNVYYQHYNRLMPLPTLGRCKLLKEYHTKMTMLLMVSTIMLSGNTALAAQRTSFKAKEHNYISNNSESTRNISGHGGSNHHHAYSAAKHHHLNNNTHYYNTTNTTKSIFAYESAAASSYAGYVSTQLNVVTNPSIMSSSLHRNLYGGGSYALRNVIDSGENSLNGPYFDKAASKNVTALLGKTAYLNCRVKNLGNKTMLLQVSWVRHRDIHLLTVGRYTYTSDQRFRAIHQPQTEDWILQIKYPQHRDSGIYECQVSTTPHMSHYIHLNVVEPSTEIIGAPDLYIESGSTINLTCVILNSPEPPAYIFWNHNNAIINYDSPRGGVSVVTLKGETTTSFLLIKSARPSDSGHYQCNPSNAKPKSVTVHVLNGEFPAAMQRAGQPHHRMSQTIYMLVYLLMYYSTLAYINRYVRYLPMAAIEPPPN